MKADPRLVYLVPRPLLNQPPLHQQPELQPVQQPLQLQQVQQPLQLQPVQLQQLQLQQVQQQPVLVQAEEVPQLSDFCDFLVPEDVKRSLTVFGIPLHWTAEDLRELFVPFGRPLQYRLDLDQTRGVHKGRGFVQLESAAAAEMALRSLDGFQVDSNHCLRVFFKVFKRNGLPSPYCFRPRTGEKLIPENNLFVFHVPPAWNKAKFESEFSRFGKVLSLYFPYDNSTSWAHKGYGFVCYKHHQDAARAIIAMDGREVEPGRRLKVEFKRQQRQHQNLMRDHPPFELEERSYALTGDTIDLPFVEDEFAAAAGSALMVNGGDVGTPFPYGGGQWDPYEDSDQWSTNSGELIAEEDRADSQSSPGAIETASLEKEEAVLFPFRLQVESLLSSPVIAPAAPAAALHALCDKPLIELGDLGLFPSLDAPQRNEFRRRNSRRFTRLSQRDRKKSFASLHL